MRFFKDLTPALLASAAIILASCAPETGVANPDRQSRLSAEHLQRIDAVLQEEVDQGLRAGFVALVTSDDGVVYESAVGLADPYHDEPMRVDTRFRMASMTKPIVTAGVMQLVDRGALRLDDPVSLFIPSFAGVQVATSHARNGAGAFDTRAPSRPVTVHDLLTHMSGFGYVFDGESDLGRAYIEADLYGRAGTLAERIDRLATLPLYEDPGEKWRYSFSTDVAGRLIEVVSGLSLEAYLKANFFDPLGMTDTEFFVDETDFERLAVVNAFDETGGMVRLEAGALSAASVNDEAFGIMSGGAGLVSTARDYARFMRMLLNDGTLDGAHILSPATVRLMMSDTAPVAARPEDWRRKGITFGLGGAIIIEPGYFGGVAAKGEWGWSGFWDTSFAISPADDIGFVLLAQTQPGPHMPPSRARERVKAIAYGALQEGAR